MDLDRARPEDRRRALGRLGERIAAEHLERLGFEIAARNVRTRYGEIDLIAFDGDALLFVEVKTRRSAERDASPSPGARAQDEPLAWLRSSQRRRIKRLACAWLTEGPSSRPRRRTIRFDAIGVLVDRDGRLLRLDHVEAAW
jgi:putative endonuclease